MPAESLARLERILTKLEVDTGARVRVVTRSRAPDSNSVPLAELRRWWGLGGRSAIVVADRGLAGALEAGSSFLRFEVGDELQFQLPGIFWSRLQREYGKLRYVEARGEDGSIVAACEVIISCLRSEEQFCTDVPAAAASYF